MRVLRSKVPSAVCDLNDEQAARWREGGQTVWNEDAKDRLLSARAIARRDHEAAGTPAELAAQTGFPARDIEWEAEAG